MILTMGQDAGRGSEAVMRLTDRTVTNVAIASNSKTVTLPRPPTAPDGNSRAGAEATYKDRESGKPPAQPALLLGDIAIEGVPAGGGIAGSRTRLKREKPVCQNDHGHADQWVRWPRAIFRTMQATATYTFDGSFLELKARMRRGAAIVNGGLDMMSELKK